MPNPATPLLGLTVPTVGGDNNNWGTELNADLAILDSLGALNIQAINASAAAVLGVFPETLVRVTTGALTIVYTLLSPASCNGRIWTVKKVDAGAGQVSIVAAGGALIEGQPSWIRANQFAYVRLISNGVGYDVIGGN